MTHPHTQTLYIATTANPAPPPAPQTGSLVSPDFIFSTISAGIGGLATYLFTRWQKNQEAKLKAEEREQTTKLNITEKVFNETFDFSSEIHRLIDAYRVESARAADILESLAELIKTGQQATLEQLNMLNGKVDRLEVGLQIVGCEIQEKIDNLANCQPAPQKNEIAPRELVEQTNS